MAEGLFSAYFFLELYATIVQGKENQLKWKGIRNTRICVNVKQLRMLLLNFNDCDGHRPHL